MNNPFVLIGCGVRSWCESTRPRVFGFVLLLACSPSAWAETSTTVAWTKTFGGSGSTQVQAMTTDAQGNIYIAGRTTSMDFPANGAYPSPRGTNLYRLPVTASEVQPLRTALPGYVNALAVASARNGLVYAATTSGLMRTNDSGNTWQALETPFSDATSAIGTIAPDPRDPNVVYVSAGGLGIFKTVDGGNTWTQLLKAEGVGPGAEFVSLDPLAPSTVYATANAGQAVAYRSDDGGQSWVQLPAAVDQIVADAEVPGAIYGLSGGSGAYLFWRSQDRGATWTQEPVPLGCDPNCSLLSDPVLHPNLYLICSGAAFRSRDQGATWQEMPVPLKDNDRLSSLAADSSLPLVYVAASDEGVYRSSDGGTTWQQAASAYGQIAAGGGVLFIGKVRDSDAFAAKLTPQGELVWATYLGGSSEDGATSVALDPSGNVYVSGTTQSYDFPVSSGAYNGSFAWHTAGFVTKLTPDGTQVVYSALLKLFGDLRGLAVDGSGSAYVTGSTLDEIVTTPGVIYPDAGQVSGCYHPLPNGYCFPRDPTHTPLTRPFLTKLNAAGTALSYSTYLGDWPQQGGYPSFGLAVAVDSQGNAYSAGSLLWKVNQGATSLLYSTVVPGYASIPRLATFQAAIVDEKDNLVVGGESMGGYLYTTPGVWKPWPDGQADGFLAKYDARGNLLACSSMGAPVNSLALATDGTVIAGGPTLLTNQGDYYWDYFAGSYYTRSMIEGPFGDSWFGRFTADFSQLLFSTFIGRTGFDAFLGSSLDAVALPSFSTLRVSGLPGGSLLAAGSGTNSGVSLYATQTAESAAPRIDQIINEANTFPGPISPSERIVVYGTALGAGGARLLVAGAETQVVSQSDNTIVAVVPNGIDSSKPADVVVDAGGNQSQVVPMPAVAQTLALYRANPYPDQQALVLNQDGTPNSESNPAAQGSVVAVAVNGAGKYTSSGSSLEFAQPPQIFINGLYALGADANLLPAPGYQGLLTFVKVYVPTADVSGPTEVTVGLSPIPWPPWGLLSMWIK